MYREWEPDWAKQLAQAVRRRRQGVALRPREGHAWRKVRSVAGLVEGRIKRGGSRSAPLLAPCFAPNLWKVAVHLGRSYIRAP
jgi:hypothetical protein